MLYTEDLTMRHYVGFSQIRSHLARVVATELNFNFTHTCAILMCFPLILHVTHELLKSHFTRNQNDTPTHDNISKLIKCKPRYKYKQVSQDVAPYPSYLKSLCNATMLLLMDNSMDNSNMPMLSTEPRKWIIILHSNYSPTSYSIICKHYTLVQKCYNC